MKLFISVGTTEFDRLLTLLNTPEIIAAFKTNAVSHIYLQLGR